MNEYPIRGCYYFERTLKNSYKGVLVMLNFEIQKIKAEGSRPFVEAYSKKLHKVLKHRVVYTQIKTSAATNFATAEWSVEVPVFVASTFSLVQEVLQALKKTLQMEELVLESNAKIQLGQVVFKLKKNVSKAILNANEITYIVTYAVDKKLKKKAKASVENLVTYFYDTCTTNAEDFELYINRYHHASVDEPIPANKIKKMLVGTARILQEFTAINAITCEIRATGVVLN